MLQNATKVFLVLMQQITGSVLSQMITNLRSASMGMYYKCQELPEHLCLTSTTNGEKHAGESAGYSKQDRLHALQDRLYALLLHEQYLHTARLQDVAFCRVCGK